MALEGFSKRKKCCMCKSLQGVLYDFASCFCQKYWEVNKGLDFCHFWLQEKLSQLLLSTQNPATCDERWNLPDAIAAKPYSRAGGVDSSVFWPIGSCSLGRALELPFSH